MCSLIKDKTQEVNETKSLPCTVFLFLLVANVFDSYAVILKVGWHLITDVCNMLKYDYIYFLLPTSTVQ